MAMGKDLEKAGDSIEVESKTADYEADEVNPILKTKETVQGTEPNDPELAVKTEIDNEVKEVMAKLIEDVRQGGTGTIVPALRSLYERNLYVCAIALIKDSIKTHGNISKERQHAYQTNLHKYSEAIRDYQTFEAFQNTQGLSFAPSWLLSLGEKLATLEGYQEQSDQIPASVIADARERVYKSWPFTGPSGVLGGMVKHKEDVDAVFQNIASFLQRLETSLLGGFAVVVPMLIMTLHPTLLTALLTTSIFVFAVAVIIAITMKTAEPKDVLGATAAYAAVLVVFVGTSTTAETLNRRVIAGIVAAVIVGSTLIAFAMALLFTYEQRRREAAKVVRADEWDYIYIPKVKDLLRKGLVP